MFPALPTRVAVIAITVLWNMMMCGVLLAQSPTPSSASKVTTPAAAADLESRRSKSAEELAAELKARKDWELQRRQMVEARALKRAECKQQATQHKLHLVKRWRFVKSCVEQH
jgi:hypothetical protein